MFWHDCPFPSVGSMSEVRIIFEIGSIDFVEDIRVSTLSRQMPESCFFDFLASAKVEVVVSRLDSFSFRYSCCSATDLFLLTSRQGTCLSDSWLASSSGPNQ